MLLHSAHRIAQGEICHKEQQELAEFGQLEINVVLNETTCLSQVWNFMSARTKISLTKYILYSDISFTVVSLFHCVPQSE